MNVESTITRITQWLQALDPAVTAANALFTDGVLLQMPRDKDLIVTFPDDYEAQPEQCPAMVLEIQRLQWHQENVSIFKGVVAATLYLADEAGSGTEARLKVQRWVDVLVTHCKSAGSIIDSYTRVFPASINISMGRTKGDMNAFQLQLDLRITLSY